MKRLLIIIAASLVVSTAFAQFNKNFPLLKKNSWATSISKAKVVPIKTRSPAIDRAIAPIGVRDPDTLTTPPRRCEIVPGVSTITTVAGTGGLGAGGGFSGDGGPATSAEIGPGGIALDAGGNLYISNGWWAGDRIRKVDRSGIITTVAGTGTSVGFSGDGGPATSAELSSPGFITFDSSGNLYIVVGNDVTSQTKAIRRIDESGVITTFIESGSRGFSGDGGPATSATLNNIGGIAFDTSGNLYIADYWNYRIRRIDRAGIITTVAGTGTSGFSGDGGAATSAELTFATSVAVDADGNIYISDAEGPASSGGRIRKVDRSGIITTVAGTGIGGFSGDGGPATSAELMNAGSVAVDANGNLYISDAGNKRIRKVDKSGIITTVAGTGTFGFSGDGGPATSANLSEVGNIAVDVKGNLYIVDVSNYKIRKVACVEE